MKMQRKAFTMIEIVVALAIILILVGLITVATTKVLDSSRGSSTKTFLQTGVSLFEEWRRSQKGAVEYPTHPWPIITNADGVAQRTVPYDLNPGSPDLQGIGVGLTRGTMLRFAAHPAVKRLMSNMPQDRWLAIPGIIPTTNGTPANCDYGQQFWGTYTQKGGTTGPRYFICYNAPEAAAATAAPTGADPTTWPVNWREYWLETSPANINVLSDGWNNPVLFIPACGFEARDLDGNPILVTSDGVKTNNQIHPTGPTFIDRLRWVPMTTYQKGTIVMATVGASTTQWGLFTCSANNTSSATNKPDTVQGRKFWDRLPVDPFFASAGPDGIFFDLNEPETLLDNLYSFER